MKKAKNIFLIVLRVLATAVCSAAVVIMATSHESVTMFGITMDAKYQYTPAFKILVLVNLVVSAYSLLVIFVPPTNSILTRIVVATDVFISTALTASLAGACSVALVGKNGDAHAGWVPVCDKVPNYCNKVSAALLCNFAGGAMYILIVQYSIHAAFNSALI